MDGFVRISAGLPRVPVQCRHRGDNTIDIRTGHRIHVPEPGDPVRCWRTVHGACGEAGIEFQR